MKIIKSILLGSLFSLSMAATGFAAQTTFQVSATVPQATGVTITVSSVSTPGNAFTTLPSGTTALSFDPMTYNTTNGIYLPNHYYALDFGANGGAGSPDLTLTYTEGNNPNGATNGLGYKTTATFDKETAGPNNTTIETLLPEGKMRLIDLSGTHIPYTQVQGGFARIYVGVWTGSTAAPADPSNGQPFTNGDAPGTYTGSLVVTAVVN